MEREVDVKEAYAAREFRFFGESKNRYRFFQCPWNPSAISLQFPPARSIQSSAPVVGSRRACVCLGRQEQAMGGWGGVQFIY